jgi:hypothetical protein
MITCPKCGHENDDSATNCSHCRINLQWAVENYREEAQSREAEAATGQAPAPAPDKGRLELALGALVIVLRLTGVASVGLLLVGLALVLFDNFTTGFEFGAEGAIGCVIGLLGAVASLVAARALLRGKRKPDIRRALPFLPLLLVLCGLMAGLLYGLVGVVGDLLHP